MTCNDIVIMSQTEREVKERLKAGSVLCVMEDDWGHRIDEEARIDLQLDKTLGTVITMKHNRSAFLSLHLGDFLSVSQKFQVL